MLKINNSVLKINGDWLNASVSPVPPVPQIVYNVILNQTTGGTISAQPMSGIDGTTVTLSNTPATNYTFNGYNISGSTLYDTNKFDINGSDVTCSGTFTFNDPIPPSDQITIGDTTWMNKNLTLDDGLGGIEVYEDGVYYTMAAAVRIANSIPGWRLPYRSEWTALTNYVSPNYARLWSGNASSVGFNAMPYGDIDYNTHEINKYGTAAWWWMYNTDTSSYSGPGIAIVSGSTVLSLVSIRSGHEFEDYPKIPIRLVKDV